MPAGWVECTGTRRTWRWRNGQRVQVQTSTPTGCNGVWANYISVWEATRELAQQLYAGELRARACRRQTEEHGPVIAWGCSLDTAVAKRRGLVRVDCGDTTNWFYARPRTSDPKRLAQLGAQYRFPSQQFDERKTDLVQEQAQLLQLESDG